MKELAFENTLQRILKKIILVVIGSGLITNALYIYGLAYYEGYIENLGFEYHFFPVKWEETLLWTYFASREIGASTVSFWTKITGPVALLILVVSSFIARLWMAINTSDKNRKNRINKNNILARFLVRCRKRYPRLFKLAYPPVRWLLIMEQSLWAFLASYFVLIVLFFIPLFIFVWVYFPLIGIKHGESIGFKRYELYQNDLCASREDYWVKCITLSTGHLQDKNLPQRVHGRVVVKNDSLIGVITEIGPVTMTMPALYFQITKKNECYKVECESEENEHNELMQPTANASAD